MSHQKIIYTGLFVVEPERLLELFPPVHKNTYAHHMTIAFRPKNLDGVTVGKRQQLPIIGRVVDEKGDVLLVDSDRSENAFPHITVSTIKGVPPVYANELLKTAATNHLIEYFNVPTEIEVVEGYFDSENDVVE